MIRRRSMNSRQISRNKPEITIVKGPALLGDFWICSSVPPKSSVQCSNWWVPSPNPCKSVRGMPRTTIWWAHQSRCGRACKDGSGSALDAAPDVGAEESIEVAHEDVVGPVPHRDSLPHDGVHRCHRRDNGGGGGWQEQRPCTLYVSPQRRWRRQASPRPEVTDTYEMSTAMAVLKT